MRTSIAFAFTGLLGVVGVLGVAGPARADRFTRAETNFKTNCAGCHTVGWGTPVPPEVRGPRAPGADKPQPPAIDLTGVLQRMDEATLRRFLEDPARERGSTGCKHDPQVRLQVDDLVAFLKIHDGPPPATEQVVPPRSKFRKRSDPPVRPTAGGPGKTAPAPATTRPTPVKR